VDEKIYFVDERIYFNKLTITNMISLDSPHMGLNDSRAPATVQMWNTWKIAPTDTPDHITDWVAKVARSAPGGKLKHVVFSCHGNRSYLQMGQGIDRSHTKLFSRWAGIVEKIWFRACLVGSVQSPGTPIIGDGNLFCSEIAKAARCYVVASTELQAELKGRVLPFGHLDTFEGLVISYGPSGKVTWTNRYASTYQRDLSDPYSWTLNP
jgi:hypothetical protein